MFDFCKLWKSQKWDYPTFQRTCRYLIRNKWNVNSFSSWAWNFRIAYIFCIYADCRAPTSIAFKYRSYLVREYNFSLLFILKHLTADRTWIKMILQVFQVIYYCGILIFTYIFNHAKKVLRKKYLYYTWFSTPPLWGKFIHEEIASIQESYIALQYR